MYAVFQKGNHQYRVSEGEVVRVDLISGDDDQEIPPGTQLEFDSVLLVRDNNAATIGRPYVKGAKILAEVTEHTSDKVVVQKFRRRKRYVRRKGHRQHFTNVKINQIITV